MKRRLQCRSRKAARVWATGETVDTLLSGSSPSRFESGVAYQIRSRLAERSGTGDDGEGHPAGYVGSNPTPGNGEKAMPTVSPKERDTAAHTDGNNTPLVAQFQTPRRSTRVGSRSRKRFTPSLRSWRRKLLDPILRAWLELVDAADSKFAVLGRAGSTPVARTKAGRVGRKAGTRNIDGCDPCRDP